MHNDAPRAKRHMGAVPSSSDYILVIWGSIVSSLGGRRIWGGTSPASLNLNVTDVCSHFSTQLYNSMLKKLTVFYYRCNFIWREPIFIIFDRYIQLYSPCMMVDKEDIKYWKNLQKYIVNTPITRFSRGIAAVSRPSVCLSVRPSE